MKKVINSEEANFNEFKIKKMALKGLTVLILSTSLMLVGCGITNSNGVSLNNQVAYGSMKEDTISTIKVDGINVLITEPIAEVKGDITFYNPPGGYNLGPNNICYKLTVDDGKAPDGYTLGADGNSIYPIDTEITHYAEEGYILVGSKMVKVIPVDQVQDKEKYNHVDGYAYIIEDAPLINSMML